MTECSPTPIGPDGCDTCRYSWNISEESDDDACISPRALAYHPDYCTWEPKYENLPPIKAEIEVALGYAMKDGTPDGDGLPGLPKSRQITGEEFDAFVGAQINDYKRLEVRVALLENSVFRNPELKMTSTTYKMGGEPFPPSGIMDHLGGKP